MNTAMAEEGEMKMKSFLLGTLAFLITLMAALVIASTLLLMEISFAATPAAAANPVPDAGPGVDEIVKRANHAALYQGDTCKGTVALKIVDSQGRVRNRSLNIIRKNNGQDDGNQLYLTYFKAPADVRKMVFLVHKTTEPGQDDSRWLYMPSLDLVKRIAAGDKRTSFAGSDFLYEDISGRNLSEDRHELVDTKSGNFVIRNTPLDPGSVEFSHYVAHVDQKTYLPMLVEYYKPGGQLYRIMEVVKVENVKTDNGNVYPTVTNSMVRNLETGSTTTMTYSDIHYDIPLKDELFGERYLRRPPREVMR
jgi:hypothetical protein